MSMPKRVIHIFGWLNKCGAETRIMDVYRNIDRKKVQFDFISMTKGPQYFDNEIESLGGKLFKIENPRVTGIVNNYSIIKNILKMHGPYDALHAHTAHHEGIALMAAKAAGIPVRIAHARTTGTQRGTLFRSFQFFLGRTLINRYATHRIGISQNACDYLFGTQSNSSVKTKVIPNAIDLNNFLDVSALKITKLKKELSIPDNSFVIGHIGRFQKVKNHSFLIRLFKHITVVHPESRLLLVGDGELRESIENLASSLGIHEHVIFTGVRDDIPELLNCMDICVIPSFYEGLCTVAIEAQAAGIPCLVSDRLPKEINMELDLVTYFPLEKTIDEWLEKVISLTNTKRPGRNEIFAAFSSKGFLLENEIDELFSMYGVT
ncbi:MAG: glycosyltransferase family 1 protein [Spirochaetales bacterium]|nr:glycosyltransferase family 1 protein [Spirochaetales bacterium]